MTKKGQLEVSFNWIFILIAGAGMMFFFFNVIGAQTEQSERAISSTVANRMQSVFTALQSNIDSDQIQNQLNFEMQFFCRADGHSYTVNEGVNTYYLEHQLVFTPSEIGRARFVSSTRKLASPYDVASILFVSDERNHYVFYGSAPHIQTLYDSFSEVFSKERVLSGTFAPGGHRQYIVVHSGQRPDTSSEEFRGVDVRFVRIESLREQGTINFGTRADTTGTNKNYLSRQMITGAIITGDPDLYSCTKDKILSQMKVMNNLMITRTDEVLANPNIRSNCRAELSFGRNILKSMSEELEDSSFESYITNSNNLVQRNTALRRASCPLIY